LVLKIDEMFTFVDESDKQLSLMATEAVGSPPLSSSFGNVIPLDLQDRHEPCLKLAAHQRALLPSNALFS
jgi:hypothetical protein